MDGPTKELHNHRLRSTIDTYAGMIREDAYVKSSLRTIAVDVLNDVRDGRDGMHRGKGRDHGLSRHRWGAITSRHPASCSEEEKCRKLKSFVSFCSYLLCLRLLDRCCRFECSRRFCHRRLGRRAGSRRRRRPGQGSLGSLTHHAPSIRTRIVLLLAKGRVPC